VLLLSLSSCDGDSSEQSDPSQEVSTPVLGWGVEELRPTRPGGHEWYADWDDLSEASWVAWVGDARHMVRPAEGVMAVSGHTSRMYVRDPSQSRQWLGALEVTVYARLLPDSDARDPWSGIVTDVRTNHGSLGKDLEENPCDSRGLFARLRFDGYADFGKEVRHPNTVPRHERQIWDGGMPEGVWIGYKHIVYDNDVGVVQELWVDFPDEGHDWVMVDRVVDRGGSWGKGEKSCAPGIHPAMPLYGGTERKGSESGLPNVAVLFRADEISPAGGLEYKWASIREVE
jgi:hypothetical protein